MWPSGIFGGGVEKGDVVLRIAYCVFLQRLLSHIWRPQFAKRSSLLGQQTRGGLGKTISRFRALSRLFVAIRRSRNFGFRHWSFFRISTFGFRHSPAARPTTSKRRRRGPVSRKASAGRSPHPTRSSARPAHTQRALRRRICWRRTPSRTRTAERR